MQWEMDELDDYVEVLDQLTSTHGT
jgi:hypothetical protein